MSDCLVGLLLQLRVLEMRQSGFGPTDASLLPTLKKLVQLYRKQSGASTPPVIPACPQRLGSLTA